LVRLDSFEVVVCLVEVAGGSGGQLLFGVEKLDKQVDGVDGIERGLGDAGGGPNGIHISSLVGHADGVVVHLENVLKFERGVVGLVDGCNRGLECGVVGHLFHVGSL